MIYLDNSATTKPDETVIKSFEQVSNKYYANPSSIHEAGAEVERLQSAARKQASELLDIEPHEIIFTSGGTEGNNMAIKGAAWNYRHRGKHIITTEIEHASVFESVNSLRDFGFEITFLPVDENGLISLIDLQNEIRDDTILVSVMKVNNEIGTIQPIAEIGKLLNHYPKIIFHVDAVQAIGKVPVRLHDTGIDLCTFSGHKLNGLKGTGMLYKQDGVDLYPLFHGGNQENSFRSGTENVAGNVSFVRALRLIKEKEKTYHSRLVELKSKLLFELEKIEGVKMNSTMQGAPHIIHLSLPGLKPETVIHALYEKGFAISTQSACSSKAGDKSRVLTACGKTKAQAISGLRISISYETSMSEIDAFLDAFSSTVTEFKQLFEVDNNEI